MLQLLETNDSPEWTEAVYGSYVTEAKLDSIIKEVEQLRFFQYCVCGMALLGVLAVTISWLISFFMDRRLLRGRQQQQQQQLEDEMMMTMCNDDETTSYQCIIHGAAEEEAAATANNDYEVFPKWVAQHWNKLEAQIKFEKKPRYVGLFYSREAATIALNYTEKKLQGLKKRELSEKETGQEMKNIAKEAQEYARQCVPTERHAPTVIRELPEGVTRDRNKFLAQLWFNKKTRHIGRFKTVQAAVIAHGHTKEALKAFRNRARKNKSEKETIKIMEGIVKVAQEMGNRYDGELDHADTPIPTLPVVVAEEGGTNTSARQPRIPTRKRSPATATWEENSTRSSKKLKRTAAISAGAIKNTRSRAQSTSGEDMCFRSNNKRHKK